MHRRSDCVVKNEPIVEDHRCVCNHVHCNSTRSSNTVEVASTTIKDDKDISPNGADTCTATGTATSAISFMSRFRAASPRVRSLSDTGGTSNDGASCLILSKGDDCVTSSVMDELRILTPPQSFDQRRSTGTGRIGSGNHRCYSSRPHRRGTPKKSSKVTFPNLNISITVQQQNDCAATQQRYYRQRRQRNIGSRSSVLLSLLLEPRRNRRSKPYLVSFTLLLMTISSFSSIFMLLKNQQQRHFHHQAVVSDQRLQQLQLHRRRQLLIAANATATLSDGDEEVSSAHYRYLSFRPSPTLDISYATSTKQQDIIPYPYLLDTNVHSVVMPTVDYVAACAQSLVDGSDVVNLSSTSPLASTPVTTTSEVPDVITIEYTLENDLTGSYVVLIQRLRQRYPNVIIVLVHLLIDPSKYLHLVEQVSGSQRAGPKLIMNFQQWKEKQSLNYYQQQTSSSDYDDANDWMIQSMFEATRVQLNHHQDHRYWAMVEPPSSSQKSDLSVLFGSDTRILHYTNPISKTKFLPSSHGGSNIAKFTEQMISFWKHFSFLDDGSITLSSYGHECISHAVRKLVELHTINEQPLEKKKLGGHQHDVNQNVLKLRGNIERSTGSKNDYKKEIVGDWGSGDDCHIWYLDGNYHTLKVIGGRPVNVPVTTYDDVRSNNKETTTTKILNFARFIRNTVLPTPSLSHKHALEFSRSISTSFFDPTLKSSYIVVNNPFTTSRLLSLSYLTDSDGMSYPKTLIVVNDVPTVQLHPIHDLTVTNNDIANENNRHPQQQEQHIVKTSSVGYVPPGKSMLRFMPLQDTAFPFRLVGVSILAEEQQHSIEYAFEIDMTLSVAATETVEN